jgi:oxaloacetate decarboxylase beta subunit
MQISWDSLLTLLSGVTHLTWANLLMMLIGGVLIYLAIAKEYEPMLLIPIGVGAILGNIPGAGMGIDVRAVAAGVQTEGVFLPLYKAGIETELFPLLLFIGIGAMTDFGPLLSNPRMVLVGAAGQFGIFGVLLLALASGMFTLNQAASIGIIGAIDGPTSIFVSSELAPELLAPITVCAYTYMSLVPIIMMPLLRLLTTKKERAVRMPYAERPVSKRARILFPVIVTLVIGFVAPQASPLIGTLMFGNLMRESGVVDAAGFDLRRDEGRPILCQRADARHPGVGHPGIRAGHHRRHPVRQAAQCDDPRQFQPADRCGRHQRVSHGRARGQPGGAGGGL